MKRILAACLSALLLAALLPVLAQGRSAAIAVAANGETVSAAVGNQLGRSPFFLLFDANGAFVSAESNAYKDAGNAGISAVDFLASKGVKVIVAEGFGGQISRVIKDKGIRSVEFKGTAKDAARKATELK
jgi:predicted Fe-Mo cluster-binding NifX family protein